MARSDSITTRCAASSKRRMRWLGIWWTKKLPPNPLQRVPATTHRVSNKASRNLHSHAWLVDSHLYRFPWLFAPRAPGGGAAVRLCQPCAHRRTKRSREVARRRARQRPGLPTGTAQNTASHSASSIQAPAAPARLEYIQAQRKTLHLTHSASSIQAHPVQGVVRDT